MKSGDKVIVSSKYFNEYNDMTGTVVNVFDKQFHIEVRIDEEFDVQGIKVFDRKELKKQKQDNQ